MSEKLKELRGQLQERRDRLAKVFEEAGPDNDMDNVKSLEGDSAAKVDQIRSLNDEMTDLSKQIGGLEELDGIKQRNDELGTVEPFPGYGTGTKGGRQETQEAAKTIGELFIESESVKSWANGRPGQNVSVEAPYLGLKATFTTTASTLGALSYQNVPGIQLIGLERLTVADLLSSGQTTSQTIQYVQETSFTNAATTVAEGAAKPEATWATNLATAVVQKIAVLSRVTDEMFADFPMIRDYIDSRMRFMVAQREEAQLLNGNGTPPNIRGILQTSGIQTQAKSTDPTPDAFYKAITKIRSVGFFEPDGVVVHPDDWTDVRLLRTADGIYIWGAPMDPGPERIWGLPVVVTTAIGVGTGLVGAFKIGAQIFRRQGVTVDATNSNEDDFKNNLVMLRAEERLALAVWRPKAFCTCTGI